MLQQDSTPLLHPMLQQYSSNRNIARLLTASSAVCRRRIGRWLTDVTPLLPLLTSQQCHFHLQTAPWALTWTPSLNLRFTNHTSFTNPPPSTISQQHDGSVHAANLGTLYREQPPASYNNAVPQDYQQWHQQQQLQQPSTSGWDQVSGSTKLYHEQLPASHSNAVPQDNQQSLQQPSNSEWDQISGFTQATDQRHTSSGLNSQFRQVHMGATAGFEARGGRLVPDSILPLFVGGPFDADYNKRYKPVKFGVPHDAQRVLLEAVITGAGCFAVSLIVRGHLHSV